MVKHESVVVEKLRSFQSFLNEVFIEKGAF